MGDELRVDPAALNNAGAAFGEAASGLAALQPEAPLNAAAAGVPGLRTADACRTAGTALGQQKDVAAKDAAGYGTDLAAAAAKYSGTDADAASAVNGAMPGS